MDELFDRREWLVSRRQRFCPELAVFAKVRHMQSVSGPGPVLRRGPVDNRNGMSPSIVIGKRGNSRGSSKSIPGGRIGKHDSRKLWSLIVVESGRNVGNLE